MGEKRKLSDMFSGGSEPEEGVVSSSNDPREKYLTVTIILGLSDQDHRTFEHIFLATQECQIKNSVLAKKIAFQKFTNISIQQKPTNKNVVNYDYHGIECQCQLNYNCDKTILLI